MSLEEYDTAKEMLDSFARLMRYSLANIKSYVTVRQELDYIESYLAIQKIRFGSRIDYTIHCAKELEGMFIPFFSIQPLVPYKRLAKLCADMRGSEPPEAQHVGLYNCYHRFHMSFKKRVSFNIKSQPGKGTVITIKIQKE